MREVDRLRGRSTGPFAHDQSAACRAASRWRRPASLLGDGRASTSRRRRCCGPACVLRARRGQWRAASGRGLVVARAETDDDFIPPRPDPVIRRPAAEPTVNVVDGEGASRSAAFPLPADTSNPTVSTMEPAQHVRTHAFIPISLGIAGQTRTPGSKLENRQIQSGSRPAPAPNIVP